MRKPAKPFPESTGASSPSPVSDSPRLQPTPGRAAAAAPAAGSTLSRRSLVASMAAGMMPAGPIATSAGEGGDARLLELGRRYQDLCALEAAADEAYERACERVQEVERPPVLRHRMEDHLLGLQLPFDQVNASAGFSAEPERNAFYTAEEIRRLRHAPPLEEPAARAEQRVRIEEIEAAWRAHVASFHAAEEAAGVNAAQEAIDEVGRMKRTLVQEIAAIPAKTLAGIRVRAAIVANLVDDTGDDDCNDDLLLAAIIRDILVMTA